MKRNKLDCKLYLFFVTAKEVDENGVDGKAALDQTLDTDPTNAFEVCFEVFSY